MKQKITFLSFIFFIVLFSFGQRKEPNHEKFRIERQIRNINLSENIFSKAHLFIKNKWVSQNSKKNFSQSISSPLVIKYGLDYEISQAWEGTSSQWVNKVKTEHTYDTNANLTQYTDYSWDISQWINDWKAEYTYDVNGYLTQSVGFSWDITQWNIVVKLEHVYDTNGNLSQSIGYSWNISQWDIGVKVEHVYDTNGNLSQSIVYGWYGSQWVNNWKAEHVYDTNGNLSQSIDYVWYGYQWVSDWKTEYTYGTNANLTQYIDYSWDISQWINDWKAEYTYDTNGNLIQGIDYSWDVSEWMNKRRTDFNYNNSYSFSDLILPFFYANTEMKKFFNHMMTNSIGYIWDSNLNNWVISNNFDFSYSEKEILSISEIIEGQLKIYPNPASNILTIKSDTILFDKVEIYSVLGKKIKEIHIDFNNIHIEDLSKGIYLLRIYSEKGTVLKKLIKK